MLSQFCEPSRKKRYEFASGMSLPDSEVPVLDPPSSGKNGSSAHRNARSRKSQQAAYGNCKKALLIMAILGIFSMFEMENLTVKGQDVFANTTSDTAYTEQDSVDEVTTAD